MKKVFTILVAVLLTASVFAQSPEEMSYQAVIRNSSNQLIVNTIVGMKISIQKEVFGFPPTYQNVYVETHTPTTNENGLVSLRIGQGTVVGGVFANIDWSNGKYYIKTETDPTGGTSYSITGRSQLLSVPYALHAKTAEDGEKDGTAPGQMKYWNGTAWVTVAAGNEGQLLVFTGGVPTWTTAVGLTMLGPTDVYNPATGKVWMDRNLGASQVATSSTDANAYGDLYQWGRAADGHQLRTSGTTAVLATSNNPGHGNFILTSSSPYDWRNPQNANLWQGVSGINNPCPSGYRLPTEAEWDAERTSWGSNNAAGAFASPLKLPMAGLRNIIFGTIVNVGSYGYYWSSTVNGAYAKSLFFGSSEAGMDSSNRAFGYSVRCLED